MPTGARLRAYSLGAAWLSCVSARPRLTDAPEWLVWQRKHEPFAPPLKEGKYADRGHMVKALDGRHAGKWGVVTDIKYHQFTVEFEDGNVEVSHGQAGGTRGRRWV